MYAPLYNKIKELSLTYPMHMPGHKRSSGILPTDLIQFDITEVEGSDNLHNPSGVIKQAQELMATHCGSDYSFFCVNGGSSGILAAVMGVCGSSDTLLAVRNAHKSLNNALILSGAKAMYFSPDITEYGFASIVEPDDIDVILKKNPQIKAVFIVSPTYEGICSDISAISVVVHKYNKILIVDETHGAHFGFNNAFPKTAMESGADISVQSWHKTLPLPNQCAVLNVRGKRADIKRIRQAFSMVTTTSPSYIFMGLMDWVRGYYTENKQPFRDYVHTLLKVRKRLENLHCLKLLKTDDISKLTFILKCAENAECINRILKHSYNFQIEMAGVGYIIAMTSVADSEKQLMSFADAICDLDRRLTPIDCNYADKFEKLPLSKSVRQREIFYGDKEEICYDSAVGRVSADFITPFPPDIPMILAGEIITQAHISAIDDMLAQGIEVLGIENGKIMVKK